MSKATPWRGAGLEFGHEAEVACRPHDWGELEVGPDPEMVAHDVLRLCVSCHVRRCTSENESGRCLLAVHHHNGRPGGSHHRYPDLASEPVGGMLDRRRP